MAVKDILETEIPNRLKAKPDMVKDLNAVIHFNITGDAGGTPTDPPLRASAARLEKLRRGRNALDEFDRRPRNRPTRAHALGPTAPQAVMLRHRRAAKTRALAYRSR